MFDQTEMKTVIVVSTDCYDDDDDEISSGANCHWSRLFLLFNRS